MSKVFYESRGIRIYEEAGRVIFRYIDNSNDEDGDNDSFCEEIGVAEFEKAIDELLESGSCVLSEYLKLMIRGSNGELDVEYLAFEHKTVILSIGKLNLD